MNQSAKKSSYAPCIDHLGIFDNTFTTDGATGLKILYRMTPEPDLIIVSVQPTHLDPNGAVMAGRRD